MLEKAYAASEVESKWVSAWKSAGISHSAPSKDGRRAYTIVIPPPNVTGALHIGHALNNTLQDILIRWRRLAGDESCWVPGTDHGGIATQNVMEKQLKAEGKTRQELGRDAFLQRMQTWTLDCKNTILGQLSRLGCALDFGREAFTMDEPRAKAVSHAFKKFFDEGLIYRGARIVNWCVRCGTALSDIEVEHEDRKGKLWYIRYVLESDPEKHLTVATTRPETLFGDTAVALNPKDPRCAYFLGKRVILPIVGDPIPVIADAHIDMSFGTGALKVTPCHDPNDFEIWQRHLGEMGTPPQVIDWKGDIAGDAFRNGKSVTGKFAGMSREKARDAVVAELTESGLLEKDEPHKNAVGVCYRCSQVVEPLVSDQWFMKMGPLAQKALGALESGDFRLHPDTWNAPYSKWLKEIRDWCLSRQIWWGHRIPVWYDAERLADALQVSLSGQAGTFSELRKKGVALDSLEAEGTWRFTGDAKAAGVVVSADRPKMTGHWLQDQDVLDTWFSSALWPLSVFGWPEKTADLAFYYPTSVLVTGYEILYLWVARMQMMGLQFMGKVPFADCVLHGIVRDKSGKKMSKSLGNVIDPLTMMDKFGTDALRFALSSQAYPGKDIPFSEDSLTGPRNFANKLWNSTRFVLMRMPETAPKGGYSLDHLDRSRLELADRWILSEYQRVLAEAAAHYDAYRIAAAADVLYAFLWDSYCDWYVELAKPRLDDPAAAETVKTILVCVLTGTLKMLHPVMPFITEELYSALKGYAGENSEYILKAGAPHAEPAWRDAEAEFSMGFVMTAVRSLRALRSQLQVPPGLELSAVHSQGADADALVKNSSYIMRLAKLASFSPAKDRPAASAAALAGKAAIYVPLSGIVDIAKERQRLQKDLEKLLKDLGSCEQRLNNQDFMARAPSEEVAKIRSRGEELRVQQASLSDTLASLQGV